MNQWTKRAICAGSMLVLLVGCGGPKPMRMNVAVGDSRTGSVTASSQLTIAAGMNADFTTNEELRLKLDVKEIAPEDGPITIGATIQSYDFGVSISMAGQDVTSMLPIDTMFGDSMKAVEGMTFDLKISPRGELLEIVGADEIQKAFHDAVKQPMPGMQMGGMNDALSKGEMERYCSVMFCPFPEEPVTKAGSWNSNRHISSGLEADLNYTWSQESETESFATFVATTEFKTVPGAETGSMLGGVSATGDISGTGDAKREVERASGWVLEGTDTVNISGTVKPEAGLPIPGNGELSLSGKTTVTAKTY